MLKDPGWTHIKRPCPGWDSNPKPYSDSVSLNLMQQTWRLENVTFKVSNSWDDPFHRANAVNVNSRLTPSNLTPNTLLGLFCCHSNASTTLTHEDLLYAACVRLDVQETADQATFAAVRTTEFGQSLAKFRHWNDSAAHSTHSTTSSMSGFSCPLCSVIHLFL